MKTKDYIFPLIAIPVGLVFFTICFLLYFNSDSKKLIHAKLKVGAFLLSFSWFVSCGTVQHSCYDVAPPANSVVMELGNTIHVGDTVRGHFYQPGYLNYSAIIHNVKDSSIIQSTLVTPQADSITAYKPEFYFVLGESIKPGRYILKLYGEKSPQILKSDFLEQYNFTVEAQP